MSQPPADFLLRMYEKSPVGFYRSTFDGRFVFVNPALVRMLGYERAEDVLRLRLAEDVYFHPDERAALIAKYREAGVLDGLTVRWRTRDGRPLVVSVYGYLRPEDSCIDVTVIDVTELDKARIHIERQRQELERSATTLRLLWRQLPGLMWTVDRDLRITSADGASIAALGRRVEDELGKTLYQFFGSERDSLPIRRHREALDGHWVGFHQEVLGKHYEVTLGPQRAENGSIVGVIGVGLDVTTRYRLEQRMVDAQRAESLGVLAGGLAHDFNNLLVAILGNSDLGLREVSPGAPGREALEQIRAAALGAATLTTQLLSYAGRGQVPTADVAVQPIVDEIVRLSAPQIPVGITVTTHMAQSLPPIRGDAAQVRQVLMNLLTNSRDALLERGGGRITVGARVLDHDGLVGESDILTPPNAGRFVVLEVADDGPGMDGHTLRRIFDPFFSTKPNGHGLGLASVLGIVRTHGGGIAVHTAPGRGAAFRVFWPVRSAATSMREVSRSGRLAVVALPTILVVDDEDSVRDVLVRLIEDLGYAAIAAPDGTQALGVLGGASPVDAVLVDLTMPGMSGADLIAEIRLRRPELPIIVCSGYDRARRAGLAVNGTLAKPFRIEALRELLASLVGPPEGREGREGRESALPAREAPPGGSSAAG